MEGKRLIEVGRRFGKQAAALQQLAFRLLCGESVALPGCKDPQPIIDQLGIDCEAEAMTMRKVDGEVINTGYLLKMKNQKQMIKPVTISSTYNIPNLDITKQ